MMSLVLVSGTWSSLISILVSLIIHLIHCLLLVIVAALRNTEFNTKSAEVVTGDIGLIKNLGRELFTTFVVPFEISSILFLSAMVGAVLIGKKN